jgi:hypothetical protein
LLAYFSNLLWRKCSREHLKNGRRV